MAGSGRLPKSARAAPVTAIRADRTSAALPLDTTSRLSWRDLRQLTLEAKEVVNGRSAGARTGRLRPARQRQSHHAIGHVGAAAQHLRDREAGPDGKEQVLGELTLLAALHSSPQRVLSRSQPIEHSHVYDDEIYDRSIDVCADPAPSAADRSQSGKAQAHRHGTRRWLCFHGAGGAGGVSDLLSNG